MLVTGASRGIGAATARAFAEAGDRVAVNYASSQSSAEEVLHSLAGQGHVLALADLADPAAVREMVDRVAAAMGGIDVLVNNAGIYTPHEILEVSYEQWQQAWSKTLAVNLRRRRQRDMVCGAAHGQRGQDRQCRVPGRLSRRAASSSLRGEQGGTGGVRTVARAGARTETYRGDHRGPGMDRDGHVLRCTGRPRRRAAEAGEPTRAGRLPRGTGASDRLPGVTGRRVRHRSRAGLQRRLLSTNLTDAAV